ncbi:urea ABC transporter ATP-binding subunit UrtE [Zavarzinia compransoris]|uniref:Urea ABC transporter ATP-binding subunit UrtE n=1 Tax=Zavarzinia compransoris TaxID=1264899 RepID=A0A317EAB4_9PROT|nr:urea ABC transporter ATP-binding subunit UrtE [Zavarzinia compransoris]PWR23090.1 urea ABC transporter ATP-binding subunit UrtE [Zavarzinia compransoris]TDP46361.1 amino acid/amide ABC transporter ATP-binding protein 2 (HAAT family) [Zavarzinia compransoris]
MLDVRDLKVCYGQSEVLHGLNFTVKPGEIVAVVGRNGMGKSTLMKSLVGILPTAAGSVSLGEAEVHRLASHQRVKQGIAYVPQGRQIFGTMTVKENIETGLIVSGRKQVPEELYEIFPILKEFAKRRGGNLSGGQQQQLAIARALATNPKVLLLDEPTEGIQPSIIKDMAKVLRQIRDMTNLCIVVCEQVLSFVLDVADRVLVIENGRIVHENTRAEVDEEKISRFLAV